MVYTLDLELFTSKGDVISRKVFLLAVRYDRTEWGYLTNPKLAQHSYRQEPVAELASLRSLYLQCGYEAIRVWSYIQPLLCKGHDHRETSGRNLTSLPRQRTSPQALFKGLIFKPLIDKSIKQMSDCLYT